MLKYDDNSVESIVAYAESFIGKNFINTLTEVELQNIYLQIDKYGKKRKGFFGDLVEEYIFGISNNSRAEADFPKVGLELKTTPLKKHFKKKYVAKERLVFSMINYMDIISEEWETSSFLKKNKLLLLMFYLYEDNLKVTEYKFKLVHLLNLLSEISSTDILQIQKDWQTIVDKVKLGQAHLLSEADTYYLSAATKASKATDRRPQPNNNEQAKPRAFSLKPSYMNFIIQKYITLTSTDTISLFSEDSEICSIEEKIEKKFKKYLNRNNLDIENELNIIYEKRPKNHRRIMVNKILGANSNKIEELEKANITLRVIALEPSGVLKESISFPKFNYKKITETDWENSDFFKQLTTKRFLFVIFRKNKDNTAKLEKIKFWNFPMIDIAKAEFVWQETIDRIKMQKANNLPTIRESSVAHVRPHGKNKNDTEETGYGTMEVKKSFWLNAKYVEEQIKL